MFRALPIINTVLISLALTIIITACGTGKTSDNNYYSAATTAYYQIESSTSNNVTTYSLNILTNTGNNVNNAALTSIGNNVYSFNIDSDLNSGTGYVTLSNGNLAITNGITAAPDFASINTNTSIPDGNYSTLCGYPTPSPCIVNVDNNTITITEESDPITNQAVTLCNNAVISKAGVGINPNAMQINCSNNYWVIVPFTTNGVTALMLSEPNYTVTTEIAFIQESAALTPNGTYNYAYNSLISNDNLSGIESAASFSSSGNVTYITNPITVNSTAQLIPGAYLGGGSPLSFSGFAYYLGANAMYYNLIGNDTMNIYQDSYVGFYLP